MRRSRWHVPPDEILAALPAPDGSRAAPVFDRGDVRVELYAPRGRDEQRPHERDELYVVVAGEGRFRCAGAEVRFAPGDLLFVPAGMEHRFEEFGDDLVLWVVLFGPHGGYGVG
ncbi:MAG TPA: cupin domain-containing protein [Gammaproteobacteria bacterium]|nr:cupin domain-containing protein [Gammaproteobacteria bacterium]